MNRSVPGTAQEPVTQTAFPQPIVCVHVITDLEMAGAELMLYRLLNHMDHTRFHNTVVSLTTVGPVGERLRAKGIPVHALGMRRGNLTALWSVFRLARFLREQKPALVQTWMYHADLTGLMASRLAGVAHVVWNLRRSATEFQNRRLTRWTVALLNAPLSSLPTAIIVNSEAGSRAHARLGYRTDKLRVIPNGFDLEEFQPRPELRASVRAALGLPQEAFVIGMVANWRAIKGHEVFLLAASQFAKTHPDARFVLAGAVLDGYSSSTVNRLLAGPLRQRVCMLGLREDVAELLQAFDLVCSCSYGEGFPNVVGEAMACGIPCVVTDVGDSATLVGDTGLIVPPGDPVALTQAWEELRGMGSDVRRSLGEAARQRIVDGYAIGSIVSRYEQLYEQLADRTAAGSR